MDDSSTGLRIDGNLHPSLAMLVAEDWNQTVRSLPMNLEESARQQKALRRRRGISSGADLLRIILAYAVMDWSLRLVGLWCLIQGLADVSDVALYRRLRHSSAWLGWMIGEFLQAHQVALARRDGVRLRLIDASVVSQPGNRGTDWRVHLSFDLGSLSVAGVTVTTGKGGESLARFPSQPGEIQVADAGYAYVSSLGETLQAGGDVVVRINWQNLPLWTATDQRIDTILWLRQTFAEPTTGTAELPIWLKTPQGRVSLRLIAQRLSSEATQRARRKAREAAGKKGRTPTTDHLFACGFILLLTSLPPEPWPASSVLELFGFRWQVELVFKRLKSLLDFDGLRTQDPQLAQTYLLAKLLAALMVEHMMAAVYVRVPDWFVSPQRPVSVWRLTALFWDQLRQHICGQLSITTFLEYLPRLRRFLCEPPRNRPQQLAYARLLLARLSPVPATHSCTFRETLS
jgi:hypothetical protein